MPSLLLGPAVRAELWKRLAAILEDYTENVGALRVTSELDPEKIRSILAPVDFSVPADPLEALDFAAQNLTRFQTHTPHPRYFGLFNPAPATMSIAGDALTAAFNPQIAAWSHSPFAAEVERHLIRAFGEKFGYAAASTDGCFCSGGAEANHTALVAALASSFPEFCLKGARALHGDPVFYISAEAHHSFLKAARISGIGVDSVREIPVDASLRMRPERLEEQIAKDRAAGFLPFLVVGTAGTTNAGVIDPLPAIAEIAQRERLWFHADAAWGGAAMLVEELRPLLAGIELADSITFDTHKWLSVPMGAGMYLTRHHEVLDRAFRTETLYMPREAKGLDVVDPHLHTMQWSRRFIGLKLFLALMVAGWDGYAETIRHQTAMGDLLREELRAAGWEIVNQTPLPVVCFEGFGCSGEDLHRLVMRIVEEGEAWISTTRVGGMRTVLRACITNYRTSQDDVRALVSLVTARVAH